MFYQPFHELFPAIAEKETRTLTVFNNHPELPADEYGSRQRQKIEAVIAYGWESQKFYANWLGFDDADVLKELKGPALNTASPQSELAPALLKQIAHILQDRHYVDRLKRHYRMFKDAVDNKDFESEEKNLAPRIRIGRNDPCLCGSGKKYKKCCGK